MELMFIPEGTFKMGSFGNGRYENDMPRHEVTLTNPFYMAKYAVTQEQWRVVMGNNISYFKGGKLPVEDPKGPAVGQYRVLRGGSFAVNSSRARSSSRIICAPAIRIHVNGFRLVREEI
ncbi:hypothetical protein EBS67_13735 [bacterium]|jgi:formylglycine-generating enzyme required for sulfatase activity|nr:hypothetical protein [bacterium]